MLAQVYMTTFSFPDGNCRSSFINVLAPLCAPFDNLTMTSSPALQLILAVADENDAARALSLKQMLDLSERDALGLSRILSNLKTGVDASDMNAFGRSKVQAMHYLSVLRQGAARDSRTQEKSLFAQGILDLQPRSLSDVKAAMESWRQQNLALEGGQEVDVAEPSANDTQHERDKSDERDERGAELVAGVVVDSKHVRKRSRARADSRAATARSRGRSVADNTSGAIAELRRLCNSAPEQYRTSWVRLLYLADQLRLQPPDGRSTGWRKDNLCAAIAAHYGLEPKQVEVAAQLDPASKRKDAEFMQDASAWPSEMYDSAAQSVMTLPYAYEVYDEGSSTALSGHAEPSTVLGMLESGRTLHDVPSRAFKWTTRQVAKDSEMQRAIKSYAMSTYGMRLPPTSEQELEAEYQLRTKGYSRRQTKMAVVIADASSGQSFAIDLEDQHLNVSSQIDLAIVMYGKSMGFTNAYMARLLSIMHAATSPLFAFARVAYVVKNTADYAMLATQWSKAAVPYLSARQRNREFEVFMAQVEKIISRPLVSSGLAMDALPLPFPVRKRLLADSIALFGTGDDRQAKAVVEQAESAAGVSL